jgi:two-component system NarL family sensor kinase
MAEWQDPQMFAIGLSVTLLFVLILISSMILLTRIYIKRIVHEQEKFTKAKLEHQQSLLWNSVLVQEKERGRIASDLHDELISKLTVLTYALQTSNEKVKPVELLGDSIAIARRITHDLRPPLLDQTSLEELVDDFVLPLTNAYAIGCFFSPHHQHLEMKSEIKLQLFRIVQEVVNNVLKHAKATQISIRLRVSESLVALVIRDDGVGFNVDKNAKGLGLKNIELRSQLLNAKWRFKSKPGIGTAFQFLLMNDTINASLNE